MKTSLIFSLFFTLLFSNAHTKTLSLNTIEGRIIEKLSDKPLAYVNIGVVGKGVGTVSDYKGEFTLTIPDKYDDDIIRVSMIGYETQEFKVKDFKSKIAADYNIFLEPKTELIEEIAIIDSKMRSYLKGNKSKVQNFTIGFESDTLGNEFATKFKIRKRRTILKDIRLSIVENSFDTLRFRVNVYNIKNGKPGEVINKENIIISTTNKDSEVLIVDLLPYNVIVKKNFYVSLEWIDSSEEEADVSFSAAFPARTVHYRSTSHAKWRSIQGLGIGMQVTILQ
jgi:hypothetical protein